MIVNTNYNSLVSQSNLFSVNKSLSSSMEKLSSGLRINNASDDAAGLAISERMGAQVRGMEQAFRNAQDGISLAQTAEGALGTVTDMLQRARELAVQADNGTYSDDDKATIQAEITALVNEVQHIAETSNFNGINLLDGSVGSVSIHISDQSDDTIDINLADSTSATLGLDGVNVATDAQAAIETIDTALNTVNGARADLGAVQNRLDFISSNLQTSINNTSASKSRILDADMAKEMSELVKNQTLQQTTMNMLSRANAQPQSVLSLLQG